MLNEDVLTLATKRPTNGIRLRELVSFFHADWEAQVDKDILIHD